MAMKARGPAGREIGDGAVAAERDELARNLRGQPGAPGDLQAAAIRETDVRDDDLPRLIERRERGGQRGYDGHVVPVPRQVQREHRPGVLVILHEEDALARAVAHAGYHAGGAPLARPIGGRRPRRARDWQVDDQGGTGARPRAAAQNPAAMLLDDAAADGEAEPQPAATIGHMVAELERTEQALDRLGAHARAEVPDGDLEPAGRLDRGAHDHAAGRFAELDGVAQYVPEHLPEPQLVRVDVRVGGGELEIERDAPRLGCRPHVVDGLQQDGVRVRVGQMQLEAPAGDPREVEQVVDELRLDLDVALDHLREPPRGVRQIG